MKTSVLLHVSASVTPLHYLQLSTIYLHAIQISNIFLFLKYFTEDIRHWPLFNLRGVKLHNFQLMEIDC